MVAILGYLNTPKMCPRQILTLQADISNKCPTSCLAARSQQGHQAECVGLEGRGLIPGLASLEDAMESQSIVVKGRNTVLGLPDFKPCLYYL